MTSPRPVNSEGLTDPTCGDPGDPSESSLRRDGGSPLSDVVPDVGVCAMLVVCVDRGPVPESVKRIMVFESKCRRRLGEEEGTGGLSVLLSTDPDPDTDRSSTVSRVHCVGSYFLIHHLGHRLNLPFLVRLFTLVSEPLSTKHRGGRRTT